MTQFLNDEIHDVPHDLYVVQNTSDFDSPEFDADYIITGIKWLSAASDEYPYQRTLTKVLKDQVDTSDEPGDNSLQGWWTRSQTDWSGGAGQEYMEPATDDLVRRMFWRSAGVDVFTRPGFVRLLPEARYGVGETQWRPGSVTHLAKLPGGWVWTVDNRAWFSVDGSTWEVQGQGGAKASFTTAVAAGEHMLLGRPDEVVIHHWKTHNQNHITGFTGVPVLTWVKQRLMLSVGDKVWEIPAGDLAADVDLSSKTPIVDMKDASWAFVGATGTPSSILLAGSGGSGSAILSLVLDDKGALPTLTAPIEVAQFPNNEKILGIASYLGTYIGILTDKGVRVGTVSDGGGLVYGPLIGAPSSVGDGNDISMYDRFIFYPVADAGDGRGGMAIVDLSTADEDGRNAWSTWIRVPKDAGMVVDAIVTGERKAMLVSVRVGSGGQQEVMRWEADPDVALEEKGWLSTSWVRYGTLEKKYFDEVKVVCDPPMAGRVGVFALDDEVKATSLGHLTAEIGQEATFKVNGRKSVTDMALRFELEPSSTDPKVGPELAAWNMRAWPSIDSRGETVVLPLLCFDFERDSLGVKVGYEGYAKDRWTALAAVLGDGTGVQVTEQHSGFKYTAIAEDATFTQISPPTGASGFGGIAQVVFRTT